MKIIGIGNALLDVLIRLEHDRALTEAGIRKGAMDLIDEAQMSAIQKGQAGLERSEVPGGSCCNVMRAMARLGAAVGYIGKVGNDRIGKAYEEDMLKSGVKSHIIRTSGVSGCSTVLISPDGERTMATFLGLAATLSDDEIADVMLQPYDCLYLEGYLIANEALFLPVLQRAKRMGLKVALDLSNFNIVNGFRELLQEVVPEYVDILFSNESEAKAFTGLPAVDAIDVIADQVEIAVVTVGKHGVWVKKRDTKIHEAATGSRVVDTTGAGDNFAAGFLYGYSRDASLVQSAQIGSLLSGNVIETVGAQVQEGRWSQIKLKIDAILRE